MTRLDVHTNDEPFYEPHTQFRSTFLPLVLNVKNQLGSSLETIKSVDSSLYRTELLSTSHVWSPPGKGIDSHRTWEAVLGGAIPIVIDSPLRSAYRGLHVLSLSDFQELTADLVLESAAKLSQEHRVIDIFSPIFCFYWLREIEKEVLMSV